MKQTEGLWLPEFWASPLINGDYTGLSDEDEAVLNKWLEQNPEYATPVACGDETFFTHHVAGGAVSPCNCLPFTFLREVPQGLMPPECTRWDVVDAYAAFGDWWNKDGLTRRCHAKGRSISCALSRLRYRNPGDYLKTYESREIYCALVQRYHPEALTQEKQMIDELDKDDDEHE